MFKPDALAAKHAWQGDPLLSSASKDAGFLSADWTAVPKVGFERVVIRQLEEHPSARVFDDSVGFELADYERRPKAVTQPKTATPGFTVDAKPPATLDSVAFLQYTGGTTGLSKGAVLTHRNVVAGVLQAEAWFTPATKRVVAHYSPRCKPAPARPFDTR